VETCFIIQPFDGGPFDELYRTVIAPAVMAVGLTPDRVDEDPGATVLISRIQMGIQRAVACVANITRDNANVWFEYGYAAALLKPVVLICERTRERLPFDTQHLLVLFYDNATLNVEALRDQLEEILRARLEKVRAGLPVRDVWGFDSVDPHVPRLNGEWLCSYVEDWPGRGPTINEEAVTIEQRGRHLSGQYESLLSPREEQFQLEATISRNMVLGRYYALERGADGAGSFQLRIERSDGWMEGFCTWLDSDFGYIACSRNIWVKKGSHYTDENLIEARALMAGELSLWQARADAGGFFR